MRALRPAAMAVISLVLFMLIIGSRPAVAGAPQVPAGPATPPPRATSLPGADDVAQNKIDDILTSAAIVLVSGVAGIAGLMWGRQ